MLVWGEIILTGLLKKIMLMKQALLIKALLDLFNAVTVATLVVAGWKKIVTAIAIAFYIGFIAIGVLRA